MINHIITEVSKAAENGCEAWLGIPAMVTVFAREDAKFTRCIDGSGYLAVEIAGHRMELDFTGQLWKTDFLYPHVSSYIRVAKLDERTLERGKECSII